MKVQQDRKKTDDSIMDREFLRAKIQSIHGNFKESLARLDDLTVNTLEEEAIKLTLAGQNHEKLNNILQAYASYQKAQSIAPELPAPVLREGVLSYKSGDIEKARMILYRYINMEGGNPEAYYYLYRIEPDQERKSGFLKRVVILDGPDGLWSIKAYKLLVR